MKQAGSTTCSIRQYRGAHRPRAAPGSPRTSPLPNRTQIALRRSSNQADAFSPDARNENGTKKTNWPASLQCSPLLHRPSLPIEKNPEQATCGTPGRFSQICQTVTAIRECNSPFRESDETDEYDQFAYRAGESFRFIKNQALSSEDFVQRETASTCRCKEIQQGWQDSAVLFFRQTSARGATVMDKITAIVLAGVLKVNLRDGIDVFEWTQRVSLCQFRVLSAT
jgi:hypothetical protein